MTQFLINLTLALVTADLLHNLSESANVRNKVARLSAYINKKSYTEMKMKIDTRAKSYGLSIAGFVVLTGIPLAVLSFINPHGDGALWYAIIVLFISYFGLAVMLDKYHVEIERVTRPFMKSK
ncbi:MAG: hypothetical protein JWO07_831 [Candidatus Saccharibacteria bacterium]|nr:hypothetical protein [Candidatus Saccharibacteria bacterium]